MGDAKIVSPWEEDKLLTLHYNKLNDMKKMQALQDDDDCQWKLCQVHSAYNYALLQDVVMNML